MTHRQIAKQLGISHGLVLLIERQALAKIAVGLGLKPSEVAGRVAKAMRHPKMRTMAMKMGIREM